jgi:hypothetical protein
LRDGGDRLQTGPQARVAAQDGFWTGANAALWKNRDAMTLAEAPNRGSRGDEIGSGAVDRNTADSLNKPAQEGMTKKLGHGQKSNRPPHCNPQHGRVGKTNMIGHDQHRPGSGDAVPTLNLEAKENCEERGEEATPELV